MRSIFCWFWKSRKEKKFLQVKLVAFEEEKNNYLNISSSSYFERRKRKKGEDGKKRKIYIFHCYHIIFTSQCNNVTITFEHKIDIYIFFYQVKLINIVSR